MIYLIDDKRSRQQDYGWNKERFSQYTDTITPIWNMESLIENREKMLEDNSVILFHESFLSSADVERNDFINSLKSDIEKRASASSLYITYFSGSKNSRSVSERICMLPPDVLYQNFPIFLNQYSQGNIDFKFLAFGEKYNLEESIRHRLKEINNSNVGFEKMPIDKKVLFTVTADDEVEPPFTIDVVNNWDFFDEDVSDSQLDSIVHDWLDSTQYDLIYIPLYFGNVYSDYMGLRLAMHIRMTETPNRNVPIFIYGVSTYPEVSINECFEVFKFSNVYLIKADNRSFIQSLALNTSHSDACKEINRVSLSVPSNIGDNHSVANRWAMHRWLEMLKWPEETPKITNSGLDDSLYFKYLSLKHGEHDRFSNKHKYDIKISGLEGKTILYIDDEYDKGWENILRTIFEYNKARFLCFKDFDKKISREELVKRIKEYLETNDADCYLIDLRLHEDDFANGQGTNLTGHDVARYIKELNYGNQIVIFTASNKVWNLKEDIFEIDASGYVLKESPDQNLRRQESMNLYIDFNKTIAQACRMSYLKDIVNKQNHLKSIEPIAKQLDSIVNLLSRDQGKNDQDLLGAALLSEMVFMEDYIKNLLGYDIYDEGKDDTLKVYLTNKQTMQDQWLLTGHLFFKRVPNGSHTSVIDVSEYYTDAIPEPSEWCNVTKSDITLVTAVLMIVFKMPRELVKKYIGFKDIRNTQIAHAGSGDKKITVELIVDFYKTVIYPLIIQGCQTT